MDADLFRALGEPNRLRIVELLRERPHPVNEIVDRLGLQQPQVSKHLRTLVDAGLLTTYPVAQQRYHGLRPERLAELHTWVTGFGDLWDVRSSVARLYQRSLDEHRPIPTPEHPFRIEHTTAANPAAVWAAWTRPDLLAQWFAPDYFTVPTCELDPRPGGALRVELEGPDGTRYPMTGEFDEVDEPRRLSYVARPLGADGEALFSLMLTLTLDATDHGSRLTVDAAVLDAGPEAAPHLAGLEPGWRQNLTKLDRLLAGR